MTATAERNSISLLISLLREEKEINEMLEFAETIHLFSSDSKNMVNAGLANYEAINCQIRELKNTLGYPSYLNVSESQLVSRMSRLSC